MAKIDFRRKIISKIGRNSNRPWENSSRKYQNHISSVLSVKKWTMKQSMNSVFSCYHELSNLPFFFSFFFWDKDVATCNPFTQRLPTIECLLLFADTLKLLSSLTWTRITLLLSFMCYQGWARKRDLPEIEECSLVFGRSLYGSDG